VEAEAETTAVAAAAAVAAAVAVAAAEPRAQAGKGESRSVWRVAGDIPTTVIQHRLLPGEPRASAECLRLAGTVLEMF
jgi:hypothetical protein